MTDRALLDRRVRKLLIDIRRCHDDPIVTARVRSLAREALEIPASLRYIDARELADIIARRAVTPPMHS